MYYPKSHITPNLYSDGNLTLIGSESPYYGYYFSTIDGKAFTGRYIGDGNNLELSIYNETPEDPSNQFIDERFSTSTTSTYSNLTGVNRNTSLPTSPTPYYPRPKTNDYEVGEFVRYFAKKSNENIYIETQFLFENTYYIGISLPWSIRGNKQKVAQTNKNIIRLKEKEYSINGLGAYLKFNYIQYYK